MTSTSGGGEPPDPNINISTSISIKDSFTEAMEVLNNIEFGLNNTTDDNQASNLNEISRQKRRLENNPTSYNKKSNNLPQSNNSIVTNNSNINSKDISVPNNTDNNNSPVETYRDLIDKGPFILIIESSLADGNIGRVHRMTLGKILFQHPNISPDDILNIESLGKNKIKIELKNATSANTILNSNFLSEKNLRSYIPGSILFRKGVIRNVDTTINSSEMKEVMKSAFPVTDIRRITRRAMSNDNIPTVTDTETVILTFRGQILPDYVSIYGAKCKVTPYVYKVRQCLNCLRLGHIAAQCKSLIRCVKCRDNHPTAQCQIQDAEIQCLNCNGAHATNDLQNCPSFKTQTDIKKYMAYNNVGFKEARTKYRHYSEVVTESFNINNDNFPPLRTANRFDVLNNLHSEISDNLPTAQHTQNTFSKPRRSPTRRPARYENTRAFTRTHSPADRAQPLSLSSRQPIINPYRPQPHLQNTQTLHPSMDISKFTSVILDLIMKPKPTNPLDLIPYIQRIVKELLPI